MKKVVKYLIVLLWFASVIAAAYFSSEMVEGMPTYRVFMPRAGLIDAVSNPPIEAQILALYAVFGGFAGVFVFFLVSRKR